MLHNLQEVRLRYYDFNAATLEPFQPFTVPDLKGNSMSLGDGWVFIGFDTVGLLGYLFNYNNGQLQTFRTSFALQDPPGSVFEVYPLQIMGVVDEATFETWLEQRSTEVPEVSNLPSVEPFLYWPLPDYARSITCYPDSERTMMLFAIQCPGLAEPRTYVGHEGTDVGGKPNGLPLDTPVYAALPGIVVDTHMGCASEDTSCGDAYGNYLLMQHTRVVDGDVQTWFTGYAHLQTVLVEPFAYIAELGVPIALSGDTGLGGAHLHFEVRSPEQPIATNWIDPWDDRFTSSLWIGGNESPLSAVEAYPPPTQLICETISGNNVRSGPGVAYDVLTTTTEETLYEVFQVQAVVIDQAPGDWYHIRWAGTDQTGWIWSELMTDCSDSPS